MIPIDLRSRKPIYEQLVDNITALILSGGMEPGEQLPSVRSLAGELGTNPNTIQRAYAELDRRGLTVSLPGRGSFVTEDRDAVASALRSGLHDELKDVLSGAVSRGMPPEELKKMVLQILEELS